MATKLSHWMLNQSLVLFLWISKNLLISQSGQIHLEHLNVGTHTTLHLIHLHLGQRRMLFSTMNLKIFPKKPKGGAAVVVDVVVVSSPKISTRMSSKASSSNNSMAVSTVHLDLQNSSFFCP